MLRRVLGSVILLLLLSVQPSLVSAVLVQSEVFGADIDEYGSVDHPVPSFLFPINTTQGYSHTPWLRYSAGGVNYSYRGTFDWDIYGLGVRWIPLDPFHIVVSDANKTVGRGVMLAGDVRIDITASTLSGANWVLEEYTLTNTGPDNLEDVRFLQFVDYDVGPVGMGSIFDEGFFEHNDDVMKYDPATNAFYNVDTDVKNPTPGVKPLALGMRSPLPSTTHDVNGGPEYAGEYVFENGSIYPIGAYADFEFDEMNNRNLFPDPLYESYAVGDGGGTLKWSFGTLAPGQSVTIPVYFFGVLDEALIPLVGEGVVFEPPITNGSLTIIDGATFPISFYLVDGAGSPITTMKNASLEVSGLNASDAIVTYTFALADGTLTFDSAISPPHYVAAFNTTIYSIKNGGTYQASVKVEGIRVGSTDFQVFTGNNTPPVANAGPDQVVNDSDGNGFETVVLNGSLSFDPDGAIVDYAWLDLTPMTNGDLNAPVVIGFGEVIVANFSVGVHNVTLNVTDDDGASSLDNTVVTVNVVDTTPPTVTLISPANGTNFSSGTVTFNFTVTDDRATFMPFTFYLDGVANFSGDIANGTSYTTTLAVPTGLHSWSVKAWDSTTDTRDLDGDGVETVQDDGFYNVSNSDADISPDGSMRPAILGFRSGTHTSTASYYLEVDNEYDTIYYIGNVSQYTGDDSDTVGLKIDRNNDGDIRDVDDDEVYNALYIYDGEHDAIALAHIINGDLNAGTIGNDDNPVGIFGTVQRLRGDDYMVTSIKGTQVQMGPATVRYVPSLPSSDDDTTFFGDARMAITGLQFNDALTWITAGTLYIKKGAAIESTVDLTGIGTQRANIGQLIQRESDVFDGYNIRTAGAVNGTGISDGSRKMGISITNYNEVFSFNDNSRGILGYTQVQVDDREFMDGCQTKDCNAGVNGKGRIVFLGDKTTLQEDQAIMLPGLIYKANFSSRKVINLLVTGAPGNSGSSETRLFRVDVDIFPVANAGPDQTVNDTDRSGFETVVLNGSGSFDPDGTIVNFTWMEGGDISLAPMTNGDLNAPTLIGVGEVINASFSVGVHNVTLKVTDNNGASGFDSTIITVNVVCDPSNSSLPFFDDFNDGDACGWVVDQGSWSVVNGTYLQGNANIYGTDLNPALGGRMPSHIEGSNYSDFEAMVDAQAASSPTRQKELAIIFRATPDLQNFYHLRIHGGGTVGDDNFELWKYVNGTAIFLQRTHANYPSDGTWFVFKLAANGSLIRAKIWERGTAEPSGWNLTVTDSSYTQGLFAIDTYHTPGRFDNVNITSTVSSVANLPPVANAGPDQVVNDSDGSGFETVVLNGSLSFDPDGAIINFTWLRNGDLNAPVVIGFGEVINASFSVGVHNVTLNVTDDDGASDTDSVIVTVNALAVNQPPVANSGPDRMVNDSDGSGFETVVLNGSGSYDPDGVIMNYAWREGPTLLGTGAVIPLNLGVGVHNVTLTVTDDNGATGVDSAVVTVNAPPSNQPPVANAGSDPILNDTDNNGFETAYLVGSLSYDPDWIIVNYTWWEGGALLAVGDIVVANFSVGVHNVTLNVTDDDGASDTDSVIVTVNALAAIPVEIRVTPASKNIKEDKGSDFMVHVRGNYSLSSFANATTATFAEGYTVLAILGGEQLNIKVDVGVLENRTYPFTLTSIGGVRVQSNTVNATVFVPEEKGKGK